MQISKRFRNGLVLMIYQSITDFSSKEGDLFSDLDLKDWYCMNGLDEMVDKNMISKFPRCESTAGNEDGHDDDEVISHTHTIGNGGVSHSHNLPLFGAHSHTFDHNFMQSSTTLGGTVVPPGSVNTSASDKYTSTEPDHVHTYNSGGAHSHTLTNSGASVTDKNMPYYKTICFIERKR